MSCETNSVSEVPVSEVTVVCLGKNSKIIDMTIIFTIAANNQHEPQPTVGSSNWKSFLNIFFLILVGDRACDNLLHLILKITMCMLEFGDNSTFWDKNNLVN